MMNNARNFDEIRVEDDMVMSPTYTRDAARMMRDILIFEMQDIDAYLKPIKTSAPGSKAKYPVFLALVSAKIEEYGLGMPGWEEGRRGDFHERGYFGDAANTGR